MTSTPGRFQCPHCTTLESVVLDSRGSLNHDYIRRRRKCRHCGGRFSTVEITDGQYEDLASKGLKWDQLVDNLKGAPA